MSERTKSRKSAQMSRLAEAAGGIMGGQLHRIGALEENAEHLARHLAAICDAWDDKESIEEIGKQIHMASAFLLSLDSLTDGHKSNG